MNTEKVLGVSPLLPLVNTSLQLHQNAIEREKKITKWIFNPSASMNYLYDLIFFELPGCSVRFVSFPDKVTMSQGPRVICRLLIISIRTGLNWISISNVRSLDKLSKLTVKFEAPRFVVSPEKDIFFLFCF